MKENKWIFNIQTFIYSRIKAILTSKLKSKYKDLFITDDNEVPTDPKFPSIYFEFLQPVERGKDLEGKGINAIYLTVEVQVSVTKAQGINVAREVAFEVLECFKDLSFEATMPNFEKDGSGTKRMIARYSRVIGYNEAIALMESTQNN